VTVDTVMEFDNVETIKRSVEVGTGLAILPVSAAASEFVRMLAGGRQQR
jgi:hypothetical protein